MADAEEVYRAHPTADEIAEVLALRVAAAVGTLNGVEITPKVWRSWTGPVVHEETRKELAGSYEDAWLSDDR
jgi:hypothetical protein